jgi:predicted Zn-dependent peptidase
MKIELSKLKNGLEYLLIPNKCHQTLSIILLIKCGSANEPYDLGGISHFLEHMLFQGTKTYPSQEMLTEIFDSLGVDFNAFTSNEITSFYLKIGGSNYQQPLEILADIIQNSLLDNVHINNEKRVVLNELDQRKINPLNQLRELFYKKFFQGTHLELPVIGKAGTIRKIDQTKLMAYLNYYYQPKNMLIVASGNLEDPNQFKIDLEKSFGQPEYNWKKLYFQDSSFFRLHQKRISHINMLLDKFTYQGWTQITKINIIKTLKKSKSKSKIESASRITSNDKSILKSIFDSDKEINQEIQEINGQNAGGISRKKSKTKKKKSTKNSKSSSKRKESTSRKTSSSKRLLTRQPYYFKYQPKSDHSFFKIAFPGLPTIDPDEEKLSLLLTVLANGMSSRLFKRLRSQEGLVYSISASSLEHQKLGAIIISFSTRNNQLSQAKAFEIIREEIDRLVMDDGGGIDDKELDKVKQLTIGSLKIQSDNSYMVGLDYGLQVLYGRKMIKTIPRQIAEIEKITSNDILEMAKRIFDYRRAMIFSLGTLKLNRDIVKNFIKF